MNEHVNPQGENQQVQEPAECPLLNPAQQSNSEERSQQHTEDSRNEQRPRAGYFFSLDGEIDGHTSAIHNQRNGRSSGDERFFPDIEAQKRGRANATLIADQPAKNPERAPANQTVRRPKCMRSANPVRPETAANTSKPPNTIASAGLFAYAFSSAPASPPTALRIPKLRKILRSSCLRR